MHTPAIGGECQNFKVRSRVQDETLSGKEIRFWFLSEEIWDDGKPEIRVGQKTGPQAVFESRAKR